MTTIARENKTIKHPINMEMKMELVYKWHNGLTMAENLKEITGDNTFEFLMSAESNDYLFQNENHDNVVINKFGDIVSSDIGVHPIFVLLNQQRLTRTEKMLDAMWA